MSIAIKVNTKSSAFRSIRLLLYWLCGILLFVIQSLHAQPPAKPPVMQTDSLAIVQYKINQEENQRKIDSLVGQKLQEQLSKLDANSEKAQQLERELNKMKAADAVRKQTQLENIRKLKQNAEAFPVAPFDDTLFLIHLKLGSNTAAQRADNINKRIQKLYEDPFFKSDSLQTIQSDWGYEIQYKGSETILTVSEPDALWYETDAQKLSDTYLQTIKKAVLAEKKDNNLLNWTKRLGLALLILAGAFILVKVIQQLFGMLAVKIKKHRKTLFKGIHFGKFQVFNPAYQGAIAIRIIGLLKFITIIISLYLSLPLLFNVFPGTEQITQTLLGWVISPARNLIQTVLHFLPNLFTLFVIFFFINSLVKILGFITRQVEKRQLNLAGFHEDFARPTFNILRFILYAFMLVIMFPYLPGSGSPAFQGVSVFLGVLLSLGSSTAINNIIAGLVITYMRPFKSGDRIKIGDITGDVIEKTMLVIKLNTIKNEEITVPNSTVLSSNTINYSSLAKSKGLILHTTVTIGYDVPWDLMHETLLKAAKKTKAVLPSPEPFVWQTSLDDFYVSYQLNVYTHEATSQGATYSELHQHVQDCCREAGIEIMSPHYRANRDGNKSTIPE